MGAAAGGAITKMAAAKRAIRDYVRNTPEALDRFGFVVFGHRGNNSESGRPASCKGVQTLAPVGGFDAGKVERVLRRFRPAGWTPIAAALTEAGRSFRAGTREVARILLVTDGLETCGGDPIAAARRLQRKGVHVTVDVVGLDVNAGEARRLRAVARATGGRYVDAQTTDVLAARFHDFAAASRRLGAQLSCLGYARDRATICRARLRDTATIMMSREVNALIGARDEAGAKEAQRLIDVLRARADDDIEAGIATMDRRAAEVQRQLDEIAEQSR